MSKVTSDPIADMLTRIRNAIAVRQSTVSMPYSKIKQSVAEVLRDNRFIEAVSSEGDGVDKRLVISIYPELENARITEINRLSKPGRRYYVNSKEIPTVKRGRGIVVVSTSKGLMTGDAARQANIGGELICEVY